MNEKISKPIDIKVEDFYRITPETAFYSVVKKFGNGAMIHVPKKWTDKKALVIIIKE